MLDREPRASDIFNQIAKNAVTNRHKELIDCSSHPDDVEEAQKIIQFISEAGGVKEIWQPQMIGVVIDVKDEYLDEEMRKILRTTTQHEQVVTWLTINGHIMRFGWDNQKPFLNDVDYHDFPNGFKQFDFIKLTEEGAFIRKVEKITLEEIKEAVTKKSRTD